MLFEDEIIVVILFFYFLVICECLYLKDLNDQFIIVFNDFLLLRGIIIIEFNNCKVVFNVICELDNYYLCFEYVEVQIGIVFIICLLIYLLIFKNVCLVLLGIFVFFIFVMLVYSNDFLLDNVIICLFKQIKNFYMVDNKLVLEKSWFEQKIGV